VPCRDLTDPTVALEGVDPEAGRKDPTYENIEIPEEFGPVEILVDDFKVKRFAFSQDDFGDWYLREGPWGPRIAHPGLLANDLLQLFTTKYAASRVVGLHTQEELWFERPVPVGSVVRLAGRYVEKYELRGQGYVVMDAEARDENGDLFVRHRGVEIMRTKPAEVGGRGSAAGGGGPRVSGEYDTSLPTVSTLDPSVAPGTGLVPLTKEVTLEQMAIFSRIGELVRNIHNDVDTARRAGLAVPILQGQQQVCYLAELMARSFGRHWFTGGWLKVKFLRPVTAFSVLELSGAVRDVRPEGGAVRIDLDVWARHEGALVTVGWASGTVPSVA
jgi:acyl dehydratase